MVVFLKLLMENGAIRSEKPLTVPVRGYTKLCNQSKTKTDIKTTRLTET